ARMVDVWPFVPVYHSLGLGIALFSYDGKIHWGLLADRDLVPDLQRFVAALERTANEYQKLAGRLSGSPVRLEARPAAAGQSSSRGSSKGGTRASRPRARARGRDRSQG